MSLFLRTVTASPLRGVLRPGNGFHPAIGGCILARTLDTDTKRLTRLFSVRADGRGAVFDRGLTDAATKEAGFSAQDITKEPETSDASGSFVSSRELLLLGHFGLAGNLVFHFGFVLFLVALGGGVGVLGGGDGRSHELSDN